MAYTRYMTFQRFQEAAVTDTLTVAQTADRLGVSYKTIHNWIKRGAFPGAYQKLPGSISAYLIPVDDVVAIENARKQQQAERTAA